MATIFSPSRSVNNKVPCTSLIGLEELLGRARKLGLEGLIGKRSGSRYEAGKRSGAWVKIKLHQEQEFVIGGYTEPVGARKSPLD